MIGMKSILEGASVEESAIVAAGAVVMPGTVVGAGQVPVPRIALSIFLARQPVSQPQLGTKWPLVILESVDYDRMAEY